MRRRAVAVAAVGLAVAVAAESVSYLPKEPGLAAGDASVGLAFLGLGVVAWQGRPSSRSGLLMVATGFAWFAGSFAGAALFLHRGPLVHLLVGYPRGRLRSRLERMVVAAAYVDAVVYPLARQDLATTALALLLVFTALVRFLGAGGPERRTRAPTPPGCGSIRPCSCWSLSACLRICCGGAGLRPPSPAWWSTLASPRGRERCRPSWPVPSGIPRSRWRIGSLTPMGTSTRPAGRWRCPPRARAGRSPTCRRAAGSSAPWSTTRPCSTTRTWSTRWRLPLEWRSPTPGCRPRFAPGSVRSRRH